MIRIRLLHLHCLLNDESDRDEVFLKVNGKRVWPDHGRYHKMNSGERTELGVDISHDESAPLNIELWDWDLLSSNDLIGNFQMEVRSGDFGKFTSQLRKANTGGTASYMLEWEVVEN